MALRNYLATEIALDHADGQHLPPGRPAQARAARALDGRGLDPARSVQQRGTPGRRTERARPRRPRPPRPRPRPRLRRRRGPCPLRGRDLPRRHGHDARRLGSGREPEGRGAGRTREPRPHRPHPRGGGPPRRRRLQRARPGPALPRGRHRAASRTPRPRSAPSARRTWSPTCAAAWPSCRTARTAVKLGMIGFCFGGGMTWRVLDSGPSELAAAVPFYGPSPDAPTFQGSQAAVLGVFAEKDARVNAGRDKLEAALTSAGSPTSWSPSPGWTTPSSTTPARATTRRRRRRSISRCSAGSART